MKKYTSIHNLNADKEENREKAKKYFFLLNKINNAFPNCCVDKKMMIKNFTISDLDKQYPLLDAKSSPSRKLSDLFWLNLPWNEYQDKLKLINVFDIGCGSGIYYTKLQRYSNNKISKYHGIDIKENPGGKKIESAKVTFSLVQDHKIVEQIPEGTNMIISQSALEHIDYDLELFAELGEYMKHIKHPLIQIHLIPAAACLKLYQFHGIREYTPRTISKISRLFSRNMQVELFYLGNTNGNKLHYEYITKPWMIDRNEDTA